MKLALLFVSVAVLARAQTLCPWLNAASASGLLGGPVTATVTPSSCEFTRGSGRQQSILHIELQKKGGPRADKCESKPTPLMGIGNEAVACSVNPSRRIVFARVRDQRFFVWLDTRDPDAVRKAAEHVAGSLF